MIPVQGLLNECYDLWYRINLVLCLLLSALDVFENLIRSAVLVEVDDIPRRFAIKDKTQGRKVGP